jgi:hypothetical protein
MAGTRRLVAMSTRKIQAIDGLALDARVRCDRIRLGLFLLNVQEHPKNPGTDAYKAWRSSGLLAAPRALELRRQQDVKASRGVYHGISQLRTLLERYRGKADARR